MHSALYSGSVRHRRYVDKPHAFTYPLFLCYLDLGELPAAMSFGWLASSTRRAVVRFRRDDHLGDPAQPLDEAVRELVERETGRRPAGPIRLLTHPSYLGYVMNPLSVYYCFGDDGESMEALVLEVNNTPWGERHCYVLDASHRLRGSGAAQYAFQKAFHVSPFMAMDYTYRCRASLPDEHLVFHLENIKEEALAFDATLTLRRRALTRTNLARHLLRFPLMTLQVSAGIYYEALRLWWKGVTYYPHPHKLEEPQTHER